MIRNDRSVEVFSDFVRASGAGSVGSKEGADDEADVDARSPGVASIGKALAIMCVCVWV